MIDGPIVPAPLTDGLVSNIKAENSTLKCKVCKFSLNHSQKVPVRFLSIQTSALSSAPPIKVSDVLAADELFSHLSAATINTYFKTNYIHNLTRIDGGGDNCLRRLPAFALNKHLKEMNSLGHLLGVKCFLLRVTL